MTLTTSATVTPARAGTAPSTRPSVGRRIAIAVTGFAACLFPTSFGVSTVIELATGTEADHRFHQVTGQGLLLSAIWLAGLLPLVRAGWHGRTPSVAGVLHPMATAVAALAIAAFAPGAGGLVLAVVTAVTTALLLLAMPARPALRGAIAGVDPVAAPVTLLAAALLTPFVLGEIDLQNHSGDEHAEMAHYFDMGWVSLAIVLLGAIAALLPAARSRAYWTTGGLVLIGAARLVFTPNVTWSLLAMALGILGTIALAVRTRRR